LRVEKIGLGVDTVILGRNAIVREGLRRILAEQGFSIRPPLPHDADWALADCGAEPSLVVVDSQTIDEGIDICSLLRGNYATAKIVLIAETSDLDPVCRACAVGIDGYVLKAIGCDALVGALRLVMLGEKIIPAQSLALLTSSRVPSSSPETPAAPADVDLTDREVEILGRLVHGDANKIISRRLQITEATVKVHVKAVLRKLKVMNRTQAAIWAVNHGLFGPPTEEYRSAA
jgi:two-component system nitrate/nitrite response regulator NarL